MVLERDFVFAYLSTRKPRICVLQIGANDGISNDPVRHWITRFGWAGILLEPLPLVYSVLQRHYAPFSNVVCINAAIDRFDGTRILYTVDMAGCEFSKAHQFSSFLRANIASQKHWVPDIEDRIIETEVRCITFATLFAENGDPSIDVLQIDAEGYDAEIIGMFPFDKSRPSIISYESSSLTKTMQNSVATLLIKNGYKITIARGETIAVHMSVLPSISNSSTGWAEGAA